MNIENILELKLISLFDVSDKYLDIAREIIYPEIPEIVDIFYSELINYPDLVPLLSHDIVSKKLSITMKLWIENLFTHFSKDQIQEIVERQKKIGSIHANINLSLSYFSLGMGILKREFFRRINKKFSHSSDIINVLLTVNEILDIFSTIIIESYVSRELTIETNEATLKLNTLSKNTAVECERLRTLLLDWLRNTLNYLYQSSEFRIDNIPKLQYSNFGLWVIYKADLMLTGIDISTELKKQIIEIDEVLIDSIKQKVEKNEELFLQSVSRLNELVTKCSWYIASIVEHVIEMDNGTDPLTRLLNRKFMDVILRKETEISRKLNLPYSILLVDIDFFKRVNDKYGHDVGDIFLKQISELVASCIRSSDFIFRYGGEEFLIVLGNTTKTGAISIAEKIRSACENHSFIFPQNVIHKNTCSIGAAEYDGHPDYYVCIKKADQALIDAKNLGRNKVVLAQ